jgi:hypothetical protein
MKKRKAKLVGFSTRLEASVARKLKSFTKKNKLTISEVTNSSIRVFISEAESMVKELEVNRAPLKFWETQGPSSKDPVRITPAYGTDDALKAMKIKYGKA